MLTQLQIKNAKSSDTPYQLSDISGLFLRVMPNGKKIWIINKSIKGKRISKQLGVFPEMTLKEARECVERYIADNSNRAIKLKTFIAVYNEWLEIKKTQIKHWYDIQQRFDKYILPVFAERTYESIEPYEIIGSLKNSLLSQGKLETIKRICGPLKEIEIYAMNCGYIKSLKLQGLTAAFPAPQTKMNNRPSVDWRELPEVMKEIQIGALKARGMISVIMIAFYTLLRPNEYCSMEWSWIDEELTTITVPSGIMKMKKEHRVPISSQLKVLLESIPKISKYVLCSPENINKPFTINAMSIFLRRHGFKDRLVPHGIRSIGRTWMHDHDIPFDVAEKCLAHSVGTSTQLAYDRSDLLDKRRDAMQVWCDYVEECLK